MLFRRIAAVFAAAATALSPVATDASALDWAYTEICLHNRGAYSAVLDLEVVELDRSVRYNAGGHERKNTTSESAAGGRDKCWHGKITPGSTFRVFVDVDSGRRRACVAHPDRRDGFEGFFLAPGTDVLTNGTLTFRSWGTSLFPGCEPVSGEAMHSKCADESRGGFTQSGCHQWRPKVHRTSAVDMANSADRPLAYLASVVRRGADVHATVGGNVTALHFAAQYGHLPHLRFLLENGANPDARERRGLTPVMLAILHRQSDPVLPLLEAGANPNISDNAGLTPLYRAVEGGMDDAARTLVEGGAYPGLLNIRSGAKGYGLSHLAAGRGDLRRLALLAELGADLNLRENRGYTPLAVAAIDGKAEAVRQLLSAGADANVTDNAGGTPLHHAAARGRAEIVQMLLDGGADPGFRNSDGKTALDVAMEAGKDATAHVIRRAL